MLKFNIQKKVGIGFGAALFVLGMLAGILSLTLNGLLARGQSVTHTYQVINQLELTFSQVRACESTIRGYILTGQKIYLKPYRENEKALRESLEDLKMMTLDNGFQLKYLKKLEQKIQAKTSLNDRLRELREHKGYGQAMDLFKSNLSYKLMREIQAITDQMMDEESRLLELRRQDQIRVTQKMFLFVIICGITVLFILLMVYRLISNEIYQRQKAEEALIEAREKALEASRMKSEFLANMSHEIRTPMNGILGMTEVTLSTPLNEDQRRYLNMVLSSGRTLLTVINDILDFSKVEAGRITLDPAPFSLQIFLDEFMGAFGQQAQAKGLEILYYIQPDTPDGLIGDAMRLRQILTNLVGNAIKFTPQGEVMVEVSCNSFNGIDCEMLFTVKDTGIGLSLEQQQYIFEPFMQADGSITRQYGGTGLGLSISMHLIRLMGGDIWLESAPGQGTEFHFTINLQTQQQAKPIREALPIALGKLVGLPILVLDDNATSREIFDKFLSNWRLNPVIVKNADEALAELVLAAEKGQPFRIALLDVGMPDMDGFTLAAKIKENPALKATRLILLTSYNQPGDSVRSRSLGIDAFLTKPVGREALLKIIRRILGEWGLEEKSAPGLITLDPELEAERQKAEKRKALAMDVLLAEDNAVNQEFASCILTDAGYRVTVAATGQAALEWLERKAFDLILMDVHMPIMDGYTATRAIRSQERTEGGHIPIIALTADASKIDAEKCIDAGMDAYLSKPFKTQELVMVIDDTVRKIREENQMPNILDAEALLAKVNGNMKQLRHLTALFQNSYPGQLDKINEAIRNHDGEQLRENAHSLKGAISLFTQGQAYLVATALEDSLESQGFAKAEQLSKSLSLEVERLDKALIQLCNLTESNN